MQQTGTWVMAAALLLTGLGMVGYQRATSAWAQMALVRDRATTMDLASASAACTALDAARADVGPLLPLAGLAGLLPVERARAWAQAPMLMLAGQQACEGFGAASKLLASVNGQGEESSGAALIGALRDDGPEMQVIGRAITATFDALDRVDLSSLGAEERFLPLVAPIEKARAHETELRAVAALAPQAAELGGRLLGVDGPRTYLLVGQNEDEARATGGFIGALGMITVSDGRIVSSDIRSSYLWDRAGIPQLPPPDPLERYMNFGGWYLRDANWWIDFPHTAAQLLLMWDRDQGNARSIDGVIALDSAALDGLLEAVGGASVPELGGFVSAGTVESALDARRRSPDALSSYADYQRVKTEVLSGLYTALQARVTTAHGANLARLLVAIRQAADDKHLLVWFRDPDLQALVAGQNWDGRLDPGSGDFTGVVNTSISYGKVMPYIDRTVSYSRRPDGSAVLELRYTNRFVGEPGAAWDSLIDGTWWDWKAGVFRRQQGAWLGYVRALAPNGSRLLDSDGWDDTPTTSVEEGATVFGAPLLVLPGDTKTVRLVYADPANLDALLATFRQPGASSVARGD